MPDVIGVSVVVIRANESNPIVLTASPDSYWLQSPQSQYQVMSIITAGNGPLTQRNSIQ